MNMQQGIVESSSLRVFQVENSKTPGLKNSREDGFTLLEIIVAVTLVAMMAVGLWSVLRISINSWKRGTDFIDANQRNRSILDLVKKQMASIYGLMAPVDLASGGSTYPIFAGSEDSVQFISLNSLRFLQNPGLTMVSYDVARDAKGGLALVEREAQYLGMDPSREGILDRKDDTVLTIFDNLSSFSFEYFDPGAQDRPPQWMKEWSAKETGRMPTAISMTMVARDSSGAGVSRHLVIPIIARPWDPTFDLTNPFDPNSRRRMLGR
jgi:prepilin-type N-terminal cleavage/methylation domain-containing protein